MKQQIIRIGIIVDQLLAGGVQLSAIEQVKMLNKLGHQAQLIILMRKEYVTDFSYLLDGVPHEFLSDQYPSIFRKTVKFPIFSFLSSLHLLSPLLAPQYIKSRKFDVLVSMGTTTSLTTQAIYRRHHIPYLAVIHDPIEYILETSYRKTPLRLLFPFLKPLAEYFESSFIKDAKKTLIISRVHYRYLKKKYNIEPLILPIGMTPASKIPPKRGNYLLSFGRWQQKKNPLFLLTLLKKMPKIKMILAGSWISQTELAAFKKEIRKAGLSQRVRLIPHYNLQLLTDLCKQARVFLHPHFEAFGLAALEAAGNGVPIIIPEKSGVTEGFIHKKHGFFPKRNDVTEYENYISRLFKNQDLAYRMGKAAWQQVKTMYSWESIVTRLVTVINDYCDTGKKRTILVLETGHALGTSLAGGDKLMEPMARRLSNQYNFSVIVPQIGAKHWRKSPISKKIFALPQNIFDQKGAPIPVFLTYCIRIWQTLRIVKNTKSADIIYSSTNILPDVLPAAIARKLRRTFWVARIHHLIPPPNKREGRFIVNVVSYLMQQIALSLIKSKADLVIALNEPLKRELNIRQFPDNKIESVGAGIDFKTIISSTFSGSVNKYAGVYLGRLHSAKGIFDLLPIWKNVVSKIPNAKLAIIGAGEPWVVHTLKQNIEKENLTKNITLLGVLPDNVIYQLMKKAKIFLFTDHESGWGLAVAEAMANGLPVIGYDISVLETIYKDGFKVVPLRDTRQFAEEIVTLLTHESDRLKLVRLAKKTAAKLDWSVATDVFRHALTKHFAPGLL